MAMGFWLIMLFMVIGCGLLLAIGFMCEHKQNKQNKIDIEDMDDNDLKALIDKHTKIIIDKNVKGFIDHEAYIKKLVEEKVMDILKDKGI